jgi:hypothetical protein
MPKVASKKASAPAPAAKNIRPFEFHGVQLGEPDASHHAWGDCPLCTRDSKFSVNVTNGLWGCKKCGTTGNPVTFLRQFYEVCDFKGLEQLAKDRGLLSVDTLKAWGVVHSPMTNDFLIPGYSADGKLSQLYRYIKVKEKEQWVMRLLPTPELGHQLHRTRDYDPKKPVLYVNEGPWDGMAMWETMSVAKANGNKGLSLTSARASSLLAGANVIAVPGCGSVGEPLRKWLPYFTGKSVVWMGDSDHPRKNGDKPIPPAGYAATKKAVEILSTAEEPPNDIQFLAWGPEGYDPTKPSGYDCRDELRQGDTLKDRLPYLQALLERVQVIPEAWVIGRSPTTAKRGGVEIEILPCESWTELVNQWRKAMKWTEGLDRALSVMLASIASTKAVGDQLWVKIIGPAACGKSTLCEAVSINKKFVLAKSTIRGFHSGFKAESNEEEDNSLLAQVNDKTLVTKDGDTLLQSPNLGQILSEARDVYDRNSRTHYRNKASRDYEGISMTWILCGTSSLRSIDSSELGERFLDCVIMERIDEDLEDEILLRVANRTARNMGLESDGNASSQLDPELIRAMQLTGGYIDYLCHNARDLLQAVQAEDDKLRKCIHYAKYTAIMRARPSAMQAEVAERELASRLTSQITRLAHCLAIVLNRKSLDDEVMRRTKLTALNTSRGRTTELAKHLYEAGERGATLEALAIFTGQTADAERTMLKFLRQIDAVEVFVSPEAKGLAAKPRYRLTKRVRRLWEEVTG